MSDSVKPAAVCPVCKQEPTPAEKTDHRSRDGVCWYRFAHVQGDGSAKAHIVPCKQYHKEAVAS